MNDSAVRDLFRQKREEQEKRIEQRVSELDELSIDEVLRGLSDACEGFSSELLFSISCDLLKVNPMRFRIRLPEPAFYFVEHGSPFILSLLGDTERGIGKRTTRLESYMYQVRTCCTCLREPKLSIDDLKILPHGLIMLLFEQIVIAVAPPNAVAFMRCFYRKSQKEEYRNHLLEIHLMCQSNNRSTSSYLVPSVKNPYIVNAVEKIVFEIGKEYDDEIMKIQLSAMSMTPLKSFR